MVDDRTSAAPPSSDRPSAAGTRTPAGASGRLRATSPDPSRLVPGPGEPSINRADLGRRERHRLETFERLVAVTREVLFNRDLRDVSVSDITEAADVGKGTFFNYFASKEQIVPGLLVLDQRALAASLGRVERREATIRQTLLERSLAYFCPRSGEWLTYEQNLMQALLRPDVRQEFSSRLKPLLDYYAALMTLGQQDGTIRTDLPAQTLAELAHTYMNGFTVVLWIHGVAPTPQSVQHTIDSLMTLLAAPAPPAARAVRQRPRRRAPLRRVGKRASR